MFGDKIIVKKDHETVAKGLADILAEDIDKTVDRYVVTVAGESGSGKTGIAQGIVRELNKRDIKTVLIQQDDYFIYPPKTNHKFRKEGITEVGLFEVNLPLLQEHVFRFKLPHVTSIRKPLVDFAKDSIETETISCEEARVLVVEGTYVSLLDGIDKKIFLTKTYKQTFFARLFRRRDRIDRFNNKILSIEHKIIITHRRFADLVVKKDYTIVSGKSE
jgi:uridine kinase